MALILAYACNEGTGATLNPSVGTAVLAGNPTGLTWITGALGGAGNLAPSGPDGSGSFALVDSPDLPANVASWTGLTAMFHFRRDIAQQRFPLTLYSGDQNSRTDWLGVEVAGDASAAVRAWVGANMSSWSSATFAVGVWFHVAVTWDGANLRLYLNGALAVTQAAASGIAALTRIALCGAQWGGSGGGIDDLRLYDEALSQAQITTLMAQPVGSEEPPEEDTPLDTPVPTIAALTDPTTIGGSDGTVTVSWPPVANADRYVVEVDTGSGWTIDDANATSPHIITGLSAGTGQIGVTAHPEA